VPSGEKLGKDARQQLDFTRSTDELVVNETGWVDLVLDAVEQEWVLANLAKLHEFIAQTFHTACFPITKAHRK
jgi:hypothetical protein